MINVDIIILDMGGGDLGVYFVAPDFYNEFMWQPDEIKAFEQAKKDNAAQWKVALKRRKRISEIDLEDPRVLKTIYTQTWTDGEDINEEYKIGRVMNLECN